MSKSVGSNVIRILAIEGSRKRVAARSSAAASVRTVNATVDASPRPMVVVGSHTPGRSNQTPSEASRASTIPMIRRSMSSLAGPRMGRTSPTPRSSAAAVAVETTTSRETAASGSPPLTGGSPAPGSTPSTVRTRSATCGSSTPTLAEKFSPETAPETSGLRMPTPVEDETERSVSGTRSGTSDANSRKRSAVAVSPPNGSATGARSSRSASRPASATASRAPRSSVDWICAGTMTAIAHVTAVRITTPACVIASRRARRRATRVDAPAAASILLPNERPRMPRAVRWRACRRALIRPTPSEVVLRGGAGVAPWRTRPTQHRARAGTPAGAASPTSRAA
jgi:hypothetical protein